MSTKITYHELGARHFGEEATQASLEVAQRHIIQPERQKNINTMYGQNKHKYCAKGDLEHHWIKTEPY